MVPLDSQQKRHWIKLHNLFVLSILFAGLLICPSVAGANSQGAVINLGLIQLSPQPQTPTVYKSAEDMLDPEEQYKLLQSLTIQWDFDPGIPWPADIVVRLDAFFDETGRLENIKIQDRERMRKDRYFRRAVEFAKRCLYKAERHTIVYSSLFGDRKEGPVRISLLFDPRRLNPWSFDRKADVQPEEALATPEGN